MGSVFQFELKKIMTNKTVFGGIIASLLVLCGILWVGFISGQSYYTQKMNAEQGYQKNIDSTIQTKYAGDLTDEKIQLILADYLTIRQEVDQTNSFSFYPFYWYTGRLFFTDSIYSLGDQMELANKQGTKVTIKDIRLTPIESIPFATFERPLQLGNYVPWVDLFKVLSNLFILCNLFVILICSLVFSSDTSKNLNQLLFTTKLGRKKMNLAKILTGIIGSLSLLFIFQLITFVVFASLFDLSGGISSIQTNFEMELFTFPLEWNHWQTLGFMIFLQTIGILFTASITLVISAFSNSTMSAFAISLGIFSLPFLLKKVFKQGLFFKILQLFPINFTNIQKTLAILSTENYLFTTFVANAIALLLFLLSFQLLMYFLAYFHMKKWQFT